MQNLKADEYTPANVTTLVDTNGKPLITTHKSSNRPKHYNYDEYRRSLAKFLTKKFNECKQNGIHINDLKKNLSWRSYLTLWYHLENGDPKEIVDIAKHLTKEDKSLLPDISDQGFNRINIEKLFILLNKPLDQPKQIDEVINVTHDNH